jgi:hypothetical protein
MPATVAVPRTEHARKRSAEKVYCVISYAESIETYNTIYYCGVAAKRIGV